MFIRLALALALLAPLPAAAETRAYGPDPAQALDIHLPAHPQGAAPVLVMVHGGGWRRGDKAMPGVWEPKAEHWGARGYALVSVNYRMLPEADPLVQAEDVAAALHYLSDHGAELGLDPARMVAMGHSAGAHLVALVAADTPRFDPPRLAGVVALDSGAYDVTARMQARRVPKLYRNAFGTDPAYWNAASPSAQVHAPARNWLLVCSENRPVACPEAAGFARALGRAPTKVQVLPVALSHREINVETGLPGPVTAAIDGFLAGIGLP